MKSSREVVTSYYSHLAKWWQQIRNREKNGNWVSPVHDERRDQTENRLCKWRSFKNICRFETLPLLSFVDGGKRLSPSFPCGEGWSSQVRSFQNKSFKTLKFILGSLQVVKIDLMWRIKWKENYTYKIVIIEYGHVKWLLHISRSLYISAVQWMTDSLLIIVQNRTLARARKVERCEEFSIVTQDVFRAVSQKFLRRTAQWFIDTYYVSCIPLLSITWVFQWLLHYY